MGNILKKINPGYRLSKGFKDILTDQISESTIVYTGTVTQIELIGAVQPLYSCRVDLEHLPTEREITKQIWCEPIAPISMMRVPERFEKVFVLFKDVETKVKAYWISRVDERYAGPQKVKPVDGTFMEDHYVYRGIPYKRGNPHFDRMTPPTNIKKNVNDKTGTPPIRRKYYKAFPGDVISLGGYNTAIRQTYDLDSGLGQIELATGYAGIDKDLSLYDAFKNPMDTNSSSRINITAGSNYDNELKSEHGLGFDADFDDFGSSKNTADGDGAEAYVALQTTDHIRLISNSSLKPISHVALAEPLIRILIRLIDQIDILNTAFASHGHSHPMGPTIGPPVSTTFIPFTSVTDAIDTSLENLANLQTLVDIASSNVASN